MGALTSKPTAFNFRTWDVNSLMYTSCQDSLVPLIRVDIYQKKVVRVLPLEDWISDNIRFLFLNLDKQTLRFPGIVFKLKTNNLFQKIKKVFRQHTYTSVLNYLVKRINKKREKKININILLGSLFTKNINYYHRLNTVNTNVNLIAKNSFLALEQKPDVTKFNEIVLVDLNPRLDSPLFNLSLKDLDSDFFSIKTIGNYDNSYETLTNNVKILISQSNKSLIVYSENYKNSEFLFKLKNPKYNLSPVYLNLPCKINESSSSENNEDLKFNFCGCEINNTKSKFDVNFNTHIFDLNFDIFLPITNYFVTTSELISIKGVQKLKMVRPSFGLKDYILSLSLILSKGSIKEIKNPTKIYNYINNSKSFRIINRLSYSYNKVLALQKK